jgi:glucokinase
MNGMAGEFGHVTVEPDGPACNCGNHGCAEKYASASGVLRMAREAVAGGEAPSLAEAASDPEFGPRSVYDLAMAGDEQAGRIFRRFGRYLGILLGGVVNSLNLEMYVIGGGVSAAWDAFAPSMFAELRERSLVYAATAPSGEAIHPMNSGENKVAGGRGKLESIVTPAELGSDAGLYGAARAAVLAER